MPKLEYQAAAVASASRKTENRRARTRVYANIMREHSGIKNYKFTSGACAYKQTDNILSTII